MDSPRAHRPIIERMMKAGYIDKRHGARVRYANPINGGRCFDDGGRPRAPAERLQGPAVPATDGSIFVCVEGKGTTTVHGKALDWGPNDAFVVPPWKRFSDNAEKEFSCFRSSTVLCRKRSEFGVRRPRARGTFVGCLRAPGFVGAGSALGAVPGSTTPSISSGASSRNRYLLRRSHFDPAPARVGAANDHTFVHEPVLSAWRSRRALSARRRRGGAPRHGPYAGDRHARERCAVGARLIEILGTRARDYCTGGGARAEGGGGSRPCRGGRRRRSRRGRRRRGYRLAKFIARDHALPILAVPTTYSGFEATAIWGMSEGERKFTGKDARVLPRTIVYDPDLTLGLPLR